MDIKSEFNEEASHSLSQTKQKIVFIGDICVGKTSIINSITVQLGFQKMAQ